MPNKHTPEFSRTEEALTINRVKTATYLLDEAMRSFNRDRSLDNFFALVKHRLEFERVFDGWLCVFHREMLAEFSRKYPDGCPTCDEPDY